MKKIYLKKSKKNYLKMKPNKYLFIMLILICPLINISGINSPFEIRNLEQVNDCRGKFNEQTDNYIIIQFNTDVSFAGGNFLHHQQSPLPNPNEPIDFYQYISYLINENETNYPNSSFTVKNNTKLEVHFNQTIADLKCLFDAKRNENFINLISADFCHFNASSVTNMCNMFYKCSSLKTLYLSN